MRSTILSTTAVLLSALNLVNGQTFTDCNPLTNTSCPSDPALGGTQYTDFTSASSDWSLAEGTTLSYGADGAEFTIKTSTDAPTISSTKYIFFGKVSVTTKAAPGTGIVSSFILESDDLDEIDWEWLGSTDSSVESNFFGKGNTTTYDRAVYHDVATPIETWHTYTIDWTSSSIQWIIDGVTVRTLAYGDALALGGKNYPQTPMRIKMGNWVGCASVAAETATATQGTCSWAGGAATFGSNLAYTMYVQNVTIEDYGCGTEYTYGDESGSYQSIKTSGNCQGSTTESSSASAASSTSATTVKSTSSAGIFAETSTGSASGSAKATATSASTATAATTMSTATSSSNAQTSSSSTSSSSPAKVTTSDANSSKPKHQYGIVDFGVIALGLGLGYLVM